jgi:co-chaperonin GroES (HSP10)
MLSNYNKVINVDPGHDKRQVYNIDTETLLRYKPVRGRVLLRCLESDIDSISDVIIIPEEYRANIQLAEVIAVGRDVPDIMINNYVVLERANTGFEYDCDGERYLNVSYRVILAIYEPDAIERAKLEGKTYRIPKFRVVLS